MEETIPTQTSLFPSLLLTLEGSTCRPLPLLPDWVHRVSRRFRFGTSAANRGGAKAFCSHKAAARSGVRERRTWFRRVRFDYRHVFDGVYRMNVFTVMEVRPQGGGSQRVWGRSQDGDSHLLLRDESLSTVFHQDSSTRFLKPPRHSRSRRRGGCRLYLLRCLSLCQRAQQCFHGDQPACRTTTWR